MAHENSCRKQPLHYQENARYFEKYFSFFAYPDLSYPFPNFEEKNILIMTTSFISALAGTILL